MKGIKMYTPVLDGGEIMLKQTKGGAMVKTRDYLAQMELAADMLESHKATIELLQPVISDLLRRLAELEEVGVRGEGFWFWGDTGKDIIQQIKITNRG